MRAAGAAILLVRLSFFDANASVGASTHPPTHLDGIVGPEVVLIDRLEPAHVIVRVAHQVHVQLVGGAAQKRVGVGCVHLQAVSPSDTHPMHHIHSIRPGLHGMP